MTNMKLLPIREIAKQSGIKYDKLLYHVKRGVFVDAVLVHGTRWKMPEMYIEKFKNNEVNLSSIDRTNIPESSIETSIVKIIKKQNHSTVKIQGSKGWPDRLVLLNGGSCFLLEIKTSTGELSFHQKKKHANIKKLNHKVYTVSSVESFKRLLRKLTKKNKMKRGIENGN